jgi:hypothetical protein
LTSARPGVADPGPEIARRRAVVQWEVPPSRRAAFVAVLLVLAVSVTVTAAGHFRSGGYLLAGAMAFAAVCRAVLPEKYCLGLLVRSRLFDVVTATSFAVAIAVTTTILPG